MSFIGDQARQYAMDAIMNAPHPELERRKCWNLHPHRKACSACTDICPYASEIFTRANLVKDWDPCSNCGLCVSACPSRCISPSPEQVSRDAGLADSTDDTVWIGCEKSARQNSVVRDCVGALSWETLAYIALNKHIVLDLTPCGECENEACAALLRKNLTRLVEFFGQELFGARFTLAYEAADAPYHPKAVSRREMFSEVTHGSKQGTKQLLRMIPALRDESDAAMDFRLLLHQRAKQLKAVYDPPLHYGVYLPNFTSKCYGCGRCEKSCRSEAIRLEQQPDGQTRIVLTPWKCSECGLCASSCTARAIEGMKLHQLTSLGPVVMLRFTKVMCADCGKPIPLDSADGVCASCRIKRRTKKRQEEAAERARKRKAEQEQKAAAEKEAAAQSETAPAGESGHTFETAGNEHSPKNVPVGESAPVVENASVAESSQAAETAPVAENVQATEAAPAQ